MTATIVLDKDTAIGCFDYCQYNKDEQRCETCDSRITDCECGPTVFWLVFKEPQTCKACCAGPRHPKCAICNDTGLPTVEIVSEYVSEHHTLKLRHHGKLTIGPAVPIVDHDDLSVTAVRSASDRWFLFTNMPNGSTDIRDITDKFGDQDVTAGRWAHPILKSRSNSNA